MHSLKITNSKYSISFSYASDPTVSSISYGTNSNWSNSSASNIVVEV